MSRLPLLAVPPLLLALVGCSGSGGDDGDDLPPAQTGQVLEAVLGNEIEGHHSYVVLPSLRYDFTVSSPRDEIDSLSAEQAGVSAEAGDGRRFVEVAWQVDAPPGDSYLMEPPAEAEPMLALTADGERHEVGSLREEGVFAAIVVVPEDADDIGLEIEYDGRTQVIEDVYDPVSTRATGADQLYLRSPTQRWETCPETGLEGDDPAVSFHGVDCKANISSPLPYFGPLGWAPEGRAWVVVRFLAGAPLAGYDAPSEYVEYTVEPSEVRLRLEGEPAPELLPVDEGEPVGAQDDGSWQAVAVFSVEETDRDPRVRFRRVLTARPDDPAEARAVGAPDPLRRVHAGTL